MSAAAAKSSTEEAPFSFDVHTHILPKTWPNWKEKFGYGGFIMLDHDTEEEDTANMMRDDGHFFRKIKDNCWDVESRLKECDEAGIHVQVLSTVPVMFSYWAKPEHCLEVSQFLNDDMAETVAKNPARLVGLGTLPMNAPDLAVVELERCVKELGLAGVQIGSHVNDMTLDDASLFPIFEKAAELGAAILIHPWDMMGKDLMPKYWLPWLVGMPAECSLAACSLIMGGVLQRLPKLRVMFAHASGSFLGTIGRIQHGYNVRPDLCAVDCDEPPTAFLGSFWVDTLTHDADMLQYALKKFGDNRICLGSDYPFPLGEMRAGGTEYAAGDIVEEVQWDAATKAKVRCYNCLEWLGVPMERFVAESK